MSEKLKKDDSEKDKSQNDNSEKEKSENDHAGKGKLKKVIHEKGNSGKRTILKRKI